MVSVPWKCHGSPKYAMAVPCESDGMAVPWLGSDMKCRDGVSHDFAMTLSVLAVS